MFQKGRISIPVMFILSILALNLTWASAQVMEKEKVKLGNDVLWVKFSNEYNFCVWQSYQDASVRLKKLASSEKPGEWCVVFDADETIIGNVGYQIMLAQMNLEHTQELWDIWCDREEAIALPGAVEFCNLIKKLGGRVVVITNRKEQNHEATERNLEKLGFPFDALICRAGPYADDNNKVKRRQAVESGDIRTLAEDKRLPPLKILMLAGDQQHDLFNPEEMAYEQALNYFKDRFVIIPNPMYGDWALKADPYVEKISTDTGESKDVDMMLEVNRNQQFVITMDSNQTTGYEWQIDEDYDKTVVEFVSSEYRVPEDPIPGKGGKEIWTFNTLQPGTTVIRFKYVRPWEKDAEPVREKAVEIQVR